jgi:hypothetical protein
MSFLESEWKSAAGYSPRHVEFQTAQAVQRDRARADVRLRDSGDIGNGLATVAAGAEKPFSALKTLTPVVGMFARLSA